MTANVMVTLTTDTTKPLVTSFTIPVLAKTLAIPISSFTASDNLAVAGYLLTESSIVPLVSNIGWSATAPTSYTFATPGSKKLYAWAKDTTGNLSLARVASVVIDQTAPVVSALSMPLYYNSQTVPVALAVTDNVKVGGYLVTTGSTAPAASDPTWKTTAVFSITLGAPGSNTCYAWAKDTAGNVSLSRSATVFIETAVPTVNTFTVDALVAGLTIPIRALAASDTGGSGIAGYRITETATAPLATAAGWSVTPPVSYKTGTGGAKTLYAWAKDAARNVSLARTGSVYADAGKPVVTAFAAPAVSKLFTVPISLFPASDNVAVAAYLVNESSIAPLASSTAWSATAPTSYTFATTGSKKLYAWAKDTAGNVSLSRSATVFIETAVPTVDTFTVDALVAGLTIPIRALSATDSGSSGVAGYRITETATAPLATAAGCSVTPPVSYKTGTGGAKTLYAWAKDAAGNVSLARTASVYADATKPLVTSFTAPTANYALTVPINVFTASDNVAVASYLVNESSTAPLASSTAWSATAPASYTFATTGSKRLYAWAKDTAGNVSVARLVYVTSLLIA